MAALARRLTNANPQRLSTDRRHLAAAALRDQPRMVVDLRPAGIKGRAQRGGLTAEQVCSTPCEMSGN